MFEPDDPYTRDELLTALDRAHREVTDFFASIPPAVFVRRPSQAWSPSDNLEHLVRSVRPVAQALRLPRLLLRLLFGAARQPSRRYERVRAAYRARLAEGARATGRYVPTLEAPPADVEALRRRQLAAWTQAGTRLAAALRRWQEADLDACRLPHPILGKLTVREMLFFTLYHDLHHVAGVRKRLAASGETHSESG